MYTHTLKNIGQSIIGSVRKMQAWVKRTGRRKNWIALVGAEFQIHLGDADKDVWRAATNAEWNLERTHLFISQIHRGNILSRVKCDIYGELVVTRSSS